MKLGLLGWGDIAYWIHLRALRRIPGATLVAAADPDPLARERARQLVAIPVYDQAQQVLERDDIDAVVIPTTRPSACRPGARLLPPPASISISRNRSRPPPRTGGEVIAARRKPA